MDKIYDFHMHSFLSDGDLLPSEIARRTYVLGHRAVAVTDHADASNLPEIVRSLVKVSDSLLKQMGDFLLIPGVELTHVPPRSIPQLAKEARRAGAEIVVVHGETPVEPVREGTNEEACSCTDVDILAHPGLISERAVLAARANGIFLELSFRGGHCLGNGWVAKLAREAGASLLVNSDAHTVGDHLTPEDAIKIAMGAGLPRAQAESVVFENPRSLLRKRGISLPV